jgi:RNA polymerase sigma-70 factor (ECF subfamily)
MPTTPSSDDDLPLVAAAAKGDSGAFAQLFHHYYPMIYAFAYRLSLNTGDAQDIAQETFIKAARSIGAFRGDASFKNWLYQIASNSHRDFHRRKLRETRVEDELAAAVETAQNADFGAVNEALGALSPDHRQAVVLVYYEGLNHAQAARVCGCAETTISWRLFLAKRKLKALLQTFQP